jgi:hypothetical protein
MKTPLRTLSLSLLIVFGMGLGTYSLAEEITAEKHPSAAAEAPKAGMKEIPEDLTANLNVSLYSQYVWRGYSLSKDSLVIFPSMTLGYKGFAVNLWADLDTRFAGSPDKEFKLQETDVTVSYSNSYTPWKLNYSVGWILYDYQPVKNQELYVSLGLDTILKPTFCVYQEIELGQAWYFLLGVSHSIPVQKDWSLDLAGTVSYLNNKSTKDFSDFHDGNISAGLKIPLNKYLSVKPNIQYSFPLSSKASDEIKANSLTKDGFTGNGNSNYVYGGIIFDLAI